MTTNLSLVCSVCEGEYLTKSQWSQHLTEQRHQFMARGECLRKWNEAEIKQCCLVVFSSFSLEGTEDSNGADKIIHYLSTDVCTFVTDLVWWEDRPCMAVVQFESREKIKEIISSLEDSREALINGRRIQIKPAVELADLEWFAILPKGTNAPNELSVFKETGNYNNIEITSQQTSASILTSFDGKECLQGANTENSILDEEPTQEEDEEHHISSHNVELPSEKYDSVIVENDKMKTNQVRGKHSLIASPSNSQENRNLKRRKLDEVLVQPKQSGEPNNKKHNPISTLNELTQNLYWPAPKYIVKIKGRGKRVRFTCNVVVNEVEYKWSDIASKVSPCKRQQAKTIISAYCLEMMPKTKFTKPGTYDHDDDTDTLAQDDSNTTNDNKEPESHSTFKNSVPVPAILNKISPDSLPYQLWSLCNSMTIPDADYQNALAIVNTVKTLFCQVDPTSTAVMFRNWHLKLRNTLPGNEDPLLIYLYLARPQPEFPLSGYSFISSATVTDVLSRARKQFTILRCSVNSRDVEREMPNETQEWCVKCNQNSTIFWVVPFIRLMPEVQVCRLVEYMCSFDARCTSILALAKYLILTKNLRVGHSDSKLNCGKYSPSFHTLPEPHSLEWLVMFFLCYKKIVPSPREIQQQPHKTCHLRSTCVDVGFQTDPEYVREWKAAKGSCDLAFDISSEEFTLNVLSLFQLFLKFCGDTLEKDQWIVNTRDGELISMQDFFSANPNDDGKTSWKTKMTTDELAEFRSIQSTSTFVEGEGDVDLESEKCENNNPSGVAKSSYSYQVNFRTWKMYMIHPFIASKKISICRDISQVLNIMGRVGVQLKRYLNVRKSNGIKAAEQRFGTLENILTVK